MSLTIRELAAKMITNARPDVDVRPGSPMYIYLADVLGAVGDSLFTKIDSDRVPDLDTITEMFFIDRDTGGESEFTARVHFYNPIQLSFSPDSMVINDESGNEFFNDSSVITTVEQMRLYNDGVYYYVDVPLKGTTPYSDTVSLTWDNAPEEFAYISIVGVTNAGYATETDTQLEERAYRELALRNNISRSGAVAYMSEKYKGELRDIHVEGFLDPEMKRDVYKGVRLGGCTDVYAKGNQPNNEVYKFDSVPTTRNAEDEITLVFLNADVENCGAVDIQTFVVESWARGAVYTFVEGVDYTFDKPSGNVSRIATGNIQKGTLGLGDYSTFMLNTINVSVPITIFSGCVVRLYELAGTKSELFMANEISIVGPNTYVLLDRDFPWPVDLSRLDYFEPVRVKFTHHPVAAELSDMKNPVLNVTSVTVLDPLTDEDTDIIIDRHGGFGSGVFGGGGFGVGTEKGWRLSVDDENLRYSMRETGFFEIPRDYAYERIGIHYQHDYPIAFFDDALTDVDHKAGSQDALAKSFTPCVADLRFDGEGTVDQTALREYIWSLPSDMSIPDLITELYKLGLTEVHINDLYNESTYELWLPDGTFVKIVPSGEGMIELDSATQRFLPGTFDIREF